MRDDWTAVGTLNNEPSTRDIARHNEGMSVQQRRLRDLKAGAPRAHDDDIEALKRELHALHDAICAGQSLDDLGSPEANAAAMRDIDALLARHNVVTKRIAELSPHRGDKL